VELIIQPDARDGVGEMGVRGDLPATRGVKQTSNRVRRCPLTAAQNVCLWHKADIDFDAEHVRFRSESGLHDRLADVR